MAEPRSDVHLMPPREGRLRPNRALADRLAVVHREVHTLDIVSSTETESPEDALLRAIFGDPDLGDGISVIVGRTVRRGDVLIEHRQGTLRFFAAPAATVDEVARIEEGLPPNVIRRASVTVSWLDPLASGDELLAGETSLGRVDGIIDDGDPTPRLYTSQAGFAHVTRALPTAWQQMKARGIGAYDPQTRDPIDGEPLRDEQLAWLASAGAHALISEYAAYKTGDDQLAKAVFQAFTYARPVPIADGWSACQSGRVERAVSVPGLDTPTTNPTRSGERVTRLALLACGAGLSLVQEAHTLRVTCAALEAVPEWTFGTVRRADQLFSQRIFGPREDYRCECGQLSKMKDRGRVCDRCDVDVIAAKARRERMGHIPLADAVRVRRLGTTWASVPVVPPDLRPPGTPINAAYERVLAGETAAIDDVVELALGMLCDALAAAPPRADYSASAIAVVGTQCRAPEELLVELATPMLYGASEAGGYTKTLKSAQWLLAGDARIRRELLAQVMHDRFVLVGHRDYGSAMAGVRFEVSDDPIVELDAETAARIGVATGDGVALHLPISDAGQLEARQLAAGTRPVGGEGWIARVAMAAPAARASVLVDAARAGASDACTWPRAAVWIGGLPYVGSEPPAITLGPASPRDR